MTTIILHCQNRPYIAAFNELLMELICHPVFKEHDTGIHPENARRLVAFDGVEPMDIPYDETVLRLVHTAAYIRRVRETCAQGLPLDNETYTSARTFEAAVYAANATILAAERGDFAIVRPPGHHAAPDRASGFCIFNNVAIAAQHLVNAGNRVLIFDFDGHLGHGTMKQFYDSANVMYWSIHQHPAFPGYGTEDEIGTGKGQGFTINVRLPPGSGDDIYDDAMRYTLPVAKQFDPDIVAVSAGFDSHLFDPLLELRLTVDAFYQTGQQLAEHFASIFATLEGGYNPDILEKGLYNFVQGVNGGAKPHTEGHSDTNIKVWGEYEMRIDRLLMNLRPHWNI